MAKNPSEQTTIVETYSTRHDAEIAKTFLNDQGIDAFVVADDVHVPLQVTEGARLFVMESHAQRARQALTDVGMTADAIAAEHEEEEEEEEEEEGRRGTRSGPTHGAERSREEGSALSSADFSGRNPAVDRAIVGSVLAGLLIIVLFFIPYRIERNDELVWAPFYRPPITHATTFQELGTARVNYEAGTVDVGILLLQVLGILAAGWAASVVVGVASKKDLGLAANDFDELQV